MAKTYCGFLQNSLRKLSQSYLKRGYTPEARANTQDNASKSRRPPATTPAARENQMIALAVDLAEKQLREGTASAQVVTHYLKLGTTREELEKKLLMAKVEAYESAKRVEELYAKALQAMRTYGGQAGESDED